MIVVFPGSKLLCHPNQRFYVGNALFLYKRIAHTNIVSPILHERKSKMQYTHYVSNWPSCSLLGTLGDVLGAYGKYIWVNDIPVNFDSANLLTVFYSLPSLNDTSRLFFSAKAATTSKFK